MRIVPTKLEGPVLIEPAVHGDHRGFFLESYREDAWSDAGIPTRWVQDNHSRSRQGIVRGMHFSIGTGQAKLVRCGRGRILDVVVDLRGASPTFGQWETVELDDETGRQLFIPVGFAHGFAVLSEVADVMYKCSSYYDPAVERGFRFDDPDVGIPWPADLELDVSERDRTAPLLREIRADLPF
ncbi:MAG: dTDP-4-dehydrorhamnose 3,5-epimerase [Solirubrobacteraceae bacterium]|nr:dTDP-4-dehydrorhamnose 3,5-epimerase [Solirubrobacteraceae bacterium]